MQICRGRPFLTFAAPIIAEEMLAPGAGAEERAAYDVDNLVKLNTRVRRGFIRVDADEVTYPAHVILRYEIEKALFEGDLSVDDIPDLWDQKMRVYLGVSTAGNDRDGCLQDVHWPAGLFGYFPCYTLGALAAARFMMRCPVKCRRVRPICEGGIGGHQQLVGGQRSGLADRWLPGKRSSAKPPARACRQPFRCAPSAQVSGVIGPFPYAWRAHLSRCSHRDA